MLKLILIPLAIYAIAALLAWLLADRLIFLPPPASYDERRLPILRVNTDDGNALAVLHLPKSAASHTLLFSHGNGEDLGYLAPFLLELNQAGFAILAYDYRGYGLSTGGQPTAAGTLQQRLGVFSPDGRWIAYSEHGNARADIYIRSASGAGGRTLVSAAGGVQPRWTKGGREIVYLSGTAMMSVTVDLVTGAAGAPVMLFRVADTFYDSDGRTHSYDVTPSGDRFLFAKRVERPAAQPLVVVLNWRPNMGQPAGPAK